MFPRFFYITKNCIVFDKKMVIILYLLLSLSKLGNGGGIALQNLVFMEKHQWIYVK